MVYPASSRHLHDLLSLVFLHIEKVKKKHCIVQFSLRKMIWVTLAILDAAWMTFNGDIFHKHDKKI